MPNIGAPELILIVLVALVVFGPRKLPELGKSLGAGLREFRKVTSGVTDEFKAGIEAPNPQPVAVTTVTPAPAPERAQHGS
ncbi:sec-independent protein translocase protein TatA [Deinococcus metalli]|uniref:Sec-independent protein translocase protein TatA n=1 Tax=Deinococcus metalli TaxID=1141878 RepID=A0A7W8NP91_9DEIO|nr:twin-arginine translocase TatA/TatE family subunit [Deinococcus metalli]MBB5374583.1 sec-independent protein translocase protein TatA [Deinococcus metalli]GHF35222.1 hypothetical protein GCM10017781_10140 [Deinococcus metalli]